MQASPEQLFELGALLDLRVAQSRQLSAGHGQLAGDQRRALFAVLEQRGDVAGVDLVGLALANTLLGLLRRLDRIEHRDRIALADQAVVQAVPVVPGGLHGNADLL